MPYFTSGWAGAAMPSTPARWLMACMPKSLERDLLHLAIGRVVVDPVLVAAEAVARMQHRRMLVGDLRQLVEPAAGERAQPIEMRRHVREQRRLHVERQQVLELPVDGIEILPVDVGRDVVRRRAPLGHVGVMSGMGPYPLRHFQPFASTRSTYGGTVSVAGP